MNFNNGKERSAFNRKWNVLIKEYREAGMPKKKIRKMLEFDWMQLKRERSFRRYNQFLPEEMYEDGSNPLEIKFDEQFLTEDKYFENDRYSWIDELDDARLIVKIKGLSEEQIEILTQWIFEEKKQADIADDLGITQSAVGHRIRTIKKNIKKF